MSAERTSQPRDVWYETLFEFVQHAGEATPHPDASRVPLMVDVECVHLLVAMLEAAANLTSLRLWMAADAPTQSATPILKRKHARGR